MRGPACAPSAAIHSYDGAPHYPATTSHRRASLTSSIAASACMHVLCDKLVCDKEVSLRWLFTCNMRLKFARTFSGCAACSWRTLVSSCHPTNICWCITCTKTEHSACISAEAGQMQ